MVYGIVLFAALMHAVWNSMMKESDDKLLTLGAIRLVGLVFGIGVIGMTPAPDTGTLVYLLSTSCVFFVYYYFLINAYRHGDFSQVYPISRGTAPLLILILSATLGSDVPGKMELLSIVLISVGVISLSITQKIRSIHAVLYALATASAISCYTFLSGTGVRQAGSFLTFAGYLEAITGIGVLAFIWLRRRHNPISLILTTKKYGIVAGAISVFGFTSALWAMQKIPIATVGALRETSIIFAGLIGTLWLKEDYKILRIGSACLVAAGVILLGLKD